MERILFFDCGQLQGDGNVKICSRLDYRCMGMVMIERLETFCFPIVGAAKLLYSDQRDLRTSSVVQSRIT